MRLVNFGEVLEIKNGRNQKRVENPSGRYPIYGSGGIMGYADEYLCDAETIVLGRKGSINNPIFVEQPFWNVDTAFGLCANKDYLYPKYLYYFCQQFDFERLNTTVTIPSLTKTNLLEVKLPLPPLAEQRRIAAILDKVDAIRRKRQQSLKLTDDLVKSQFIEMLGDPVTNPRGWEEKRLGSLVNVRSSKRVYQREQTINGVPFLRVSDLTNKIINGVDTCGLYITEKLYENFIKNDLVPQPGDILVTSRGTLGLCYIVNDSDRFYFQDGMISWLDNRKRKINSTYLSFLFQCHGIKKQIDQASPGSTVKYLSLSNLEDFKILTPPVALQNEFAAFVEQANKTKFSMLNQIREIETLLYALMQKYFY